MSELLIYAWNTTRKYLVRQLFPEAHLIDGHYHDSPEELGQLMAEHSPSYFLFHINLTFTHWFPLCRSELVGILSSHAVESINASITDISRQWIRRQCSRLDLPSVATGSEGEPNELLIIKSNCNHGAKSERLLSGEDRGALEISSISPLVPGADDYIIRKRSEVLPAYWTDDGISIEKFINNPDHYFYRALIYRDRLVVTRAIVPCKIKKLAAAIRRDLFFGTLSSNTIDAGSPIEHQLNVAVLQTLRKFINAARIEFAAIDLVQDENGFVYIVDVNTTPYWGAASQWESQNLPCYGPILDHLRYTLRQRSFKDNH
jgi:hypothetical protein